MKKLFFLFYLSCQCLMAQSYTAFLGEWNLIGTAGEKVEMPQLTGTVRIYCYPNAELVIKSGKKGVFNFELGNWSIDSTNRFLNIKSTNWNFQWKVQSVDKHTLVLFDETHEAHITFRKTPMEATRQQLENVVIGDFIGTWVLEESGGIAFAQQNIAPQIDFSQDNTMTLTGFGAIEKGTWRLSPDHLFLILEDGNRRQIFDLVALRKQELIIQETQQAYFFNKKGVQNSDFVKFPEKQLIGTWQAKNPPQPAQEALMIFQKDGTVLSISNVHREFNKWKLDSKTNQLLMESMVDESKTKSYSLRLRALDKTTIVLTGTDYSIVFEKRVD